MPVSKGRKKPTRKAPPPPSKKAEAKLKGPSPVWYVAIMFGLMGIGALIIILNYIGLVPGGTDNNKLVLGLAGIAAGFAMTLNYR